LGDGDDDDDDDERKKQCHYASTQAAFFSHVT
jgi:hypothetical protein